MALLQMFVIKNLDTGLEMRIDDFDKLANIATEEVQVRITIRKCWLELRSCRR